jgi:ceramide glucosyltransferase
MNSGTVVISFIACVFGAVSLGYYEVTWRRLARFILPKIDDATRATSLPPVTFLRPIKPGVRDLRGKLEALIDSSGIEDQVVFGAGDPADLEVCQAVQRTHPDRAITVIACEHGLAANPKINKVMQIARHAVHPLSIVTDSECLLDHEFVQGFRAAWARAGAAAFTAGYRFTGATNFPEELDHMQVWLTLWPGLSMRIQEPINFTLGAVVGVHGADIQSLGGWERFRDHLAEDHDLGVALAAMQKSVGFHRVPATLDSDPLSWRAYFRHQHRVASTYRYCAPVGYFGMALTHGVTVTLGNACIAPGEPWRWILFLLVFSSRCHVTWRIARTMRTRISRLPLLVLIGSLLESWFWATAWFGLPVWWGPRAFRLKKGGVIAQTIEPGR